jgi:hypothetical protein
MTAQHLAIERAVKRTCALVRQLGAAYNGDPYTVEVLDSYAFFLRGQVQTAREGQRRMAEGRRHAAARERRERRLLRVWLKRPVDQRTTAHVEPFFRELLANRRDLLPQKPHLHDVQVVVQRYATEPAR